MKIIKPGIATRDLKYDAICHSCGTHFEYNRNDIRTPDPRDGPMVKCPLNGCDAYVDHTHKQEK